MQNALKFPDWKMIDYQTTITWCNRDHRSSLVLEKLRIKLAPPRGGILRDRCPLQKGNAVSTWCFHQLLCSSPWHCQLRALLLSLQPWHVHGSLAAAWQSGELAMAAAAFPELSQVQCSTRAVCQGKALPATGWDGACGRGGWSSPNATSWSKLCFLAKHFHLAFLLAHLVTLLPDVYTAKYQGADGGRAIWLLPSSFPGWSWGSCWNKGWHRLGAPGLGSLWVL